MFQTFAKLNVLFLMQHFSVWKESLSKENPLAADADSQRNYLSSNPSLFLLGWFGWSQGHISFGWRVEDRNCRAQLIKMNKGCKGPSQEALVFCLFVFRTTWACRLIKGTRPWILAADLWCQQLPRKIWLILQCTKPSKPESTCGLLAVTWLYKFIWRKRQNMKSLAVMIHCTSSLYS